MEEFGANLIGGGVFGAIAFVILGIIKAVDVWRRTGHTRETDIVGQLQNQNAAESKRNKELVDDKDKLRKRYDDAVDQNGKLRYILHVNNISIPDDLRDAP